MTKNKKCSKCNDSGILLVYNTKEKRTEVQRCDDCNIYSSDLEAYKKACPVLKYARKCDKCGKLFNEGYCVESGESYYCSARCLHKDVTPEQWKELYADGEGDSYWTSWECDEDMQYYSDGTEIDAEVE